MFWKDLPNSNEREYAGIYFLATLSNILLSVPEYSAANKAAQSYIPLSGSMASLVSIYGVVPGIVLDFLWNLLIFQAVVAVLTLGLVGASILRTNWKMFSALFGASICSFIGYWLAVKFIRTLELISLFQIIGVDSSGIYLELVGSSLAVTVCYVSMLLVFRRSYDKLASVKAISHEAKIVG